METRGIHIYFPGQAFVAKLFAISNSDLDGIYNAIVQAQQETSKPTLIKLKTIIGYGSTQQGTHGVHGSRESELWGEPYRTRSAS